VAGVTENLVPLLATDENLLKVLGSLRVERLVLNLKLLGKHRGESAVYATEILVRVVAKEAASNRSRDQRTRRTSILEEVRHLKRLSSGLIIHVGATANEASKKDRRR
jgi:hypothetical protein